MSDAWANGILVAFIAFALIVTIAFAVTTGYDDRGKR